MPPPRSMQRPADSSEQQPPSRNPAPLLPNDFEGGQDQHHLYSSEQLTTPTQDGSGMNFGRGGPRTPGGSQQQGPPPPPYIPPTYDSQHHITSPNTNAPPGTNYPRSPNTRRGRGALPTGVPPAGGPPPINGTGSATGSAPGKGSEDGEGVDPSKYKTKMCANFLNNACTWGSECAFAHGPNELRPSGAAPSQSGPRSPNLQGDAGEAIPPANYQMGRTSSWSKGPSPGPNAHSAPPPSYNQLPHSSSLNALQPPHSPTTPTSSGSNAPPPVYPTRFRHEPYSPSKAKTYISSNPTSPKVSDPGSFPLNTSGQHY